MGSNPTLSAISAFHPISKSPNCRETAGILMKAHKDFSA
jgi:hypothetical protein